MSINLEIFRKTLTYKITAPISKILEDLDEIAGIDRAAEVEQEKFRKLRNKFLIGMTISLVIVFGSLFLFSEEGGTLDLIGTVLMGLGFLGFIGFLLAAIYAQYQKSHHGRLNLLNTRYELLRKILEMVSRDMESGDEVNVRLVLGPPNQKNKLVQTTPHPYKSGFKIDHFRDAWLTLEGKFLDKTQFELTTTELNQTMYGWKTGRSGKSKYKTKSKPKALDLSLSLRYPLRRYGAIKLLKDDVRGAVKLPSTSKIRKLRVTDKEINLTVRIPPTQSWEEKHVYKNITTMFLSLYQILNLARTLSKKKEA